MSLYTDFYPEILSEVPHCPEPLVLRTLQRNIVPDFLRRTRLWENDADNISVVSGTKEYTITLPTITDGGQTMQPLVIGIVDIKEDSLETGGDLVEEWSYEHGVLTFAKTPTLSKTVALRVSLQPVNYAVACPTWIETYYSEAIIAGVAARLQKIPNKEWTNPTDAQRNELVYHKEIQRARINKNSEYGTKELVVARNDWR